jgi:hypothetical protein
MSEKIRHNLDKLRTPHNLVKFRKKLDKFRTPQFTDVAWRSPRRVGADLQDGETAEEASSTERGWKTAEDKSQRRRGPLRPWARLLLSDKSTRPARPNRIADCPGGREGEREDGGMEGREMKRRSTIRGGEGEKRRRRPPLFPSPRPPLAVHCAQPVPKGGPAGPVPAPTDSGLGYPMIDRMLQGIRVIDGSVEPLHGPGRQRSHSSAGQPDRPEGEDQLGPTTSHLGQCRRRTFRRTRQTNQMCSTNSLRLRGRHHRLHGIHRRRHSDRRAATLQGSGPVSGPVAGRA